MLNRSVTKKHHHAARLAPHSLSHRSASRFTMTTIYTPLQIAFYAVLFVVTLATISITLVKYPLFPLQTDSLAWSNNWLFATVIDYYGACLCFCGVILGTEETWIKGVLWVLGCCLLGSPVCCLWMVLHLWRCEGTLKLEKRARQEYESR
mmetsp:Transcript_10106/g.21424  ORF Transcript_10106/g.21424 Transcript_10106/m.21424 type:complete len:150 (-) Transcript_10106:1021-1470(-)